MNISFVQGGNVMLEFPQDALVGRDAERETLLDASRRVRGEIGSAELVLLHGPEGSGKTTLANQQYTSGTRRGFLCRGSGRIAVKEAVGVLCDEVLDSSAMIGICENLEDVIEGEERASLIQCIPKMASMFGELTSLPSRRSPDLSATSTQQSEIESAQTVVGRAVRVIAGPLHHVIMILDDMDEVDDENLALLGSILRYPELTNILIVVCYRNTDAGQRVEESLLSAIHSSSVIKTSVAVGLLSGQQTCTYVSKLLDMDMSKVSELAQVIQWKAMGNVAFAQDFLKHVESKAWLSFDTNMCEWFWDIERIRSETDVCDNVADRLLRQLLFERPSDNTTLNVLKAASCLGYRFEFGALSRILRGIEPGSINPQDEMLEVHSNDETVATGGDVEDHGFLDAVRALASEGIIEEIGDRRYKFSHPKVQQRALTFFDDEQERSLLHLRIAELLWDDYDGTDESLFEITDHFNKSSSHVVTFDKKVELAMMNLDAGERAMTRSAFEPSTRYLERGIALLNSVGGWKEHYQAMLGIHNLAGRAFYSLGNFARSSAMTKSVLDNAKCLMDKIESHRTIMQCLISQQGLQAASNMGFDVLLKLGLKIPRKVTQSKLNGELQKAKRKLKRLKRLDSLPLATDSKQQAVMKIMFETAICEHMIARGDMFPHLVCKMVLFSLEFGLCIESVFVFEAFAAILCGPWFGYDLEYGYVFGQRARGLEHRFTDEEDSRTGLWLYSCVNHWRNPLTEALDQCLKSYRDGMASGCIWYASWCSATYCQAALACGLPMVPIESDMRSYCLEMRAYNQTSAAALAEPVWQFLLCMMGKSKRPSVLDGEAMKEGPAIKDALDSGNRLALAHIDLLRTMLSYLFGELELAEVICRSREHRGHLFGSHFYAMISEYYDGLIAFALARKTGKRKYIRQGKKSISQLKKWKDKSAGNCSHMLALLEAEHLSLSSKKTFEEVQRAFNAAISMAGRSGFIKDKALSNERAGLYFYNLSDYDWASHYLSRAHAFYLDFGAKAKAKCLELQFSSLLDTTGDRPESTSHHGRRRYSGKSSSSHRSINVKGGTRRHSDTFSASAASSISQMRRISGTSDTFSLPTFSSAASSLPRTMTSCSKSTTPPHSVNSDDSSSRRRRFTPPRFETVSEELGAMDIMQRLVTPKEEDEAIEALAKQLLKDDTPM